MKEISEIPWLDLAQRSCQTCRDPEGSKKDIAGLLEGFLSAPTETKLRKTLGEIEFAIRRCILGKPFLRPQDNEPNPLYLPCASPYTFMAEMLKNFPKGSPYLLKLYWYLVSLQESSADIPIDSFRELARQMQEFCLRPVPPPPPPPPPRPTNVAQPAPAINYSSRRLSGELNDLSHSNLFPEKIFSTLRDMYGDHQERLDEITLSQFFITLAKRCRPLLNQKRTRLFIKELISRLPEFLPTLPGRNLSNILWSLVSFDYYHKEVIRDLFTATKNHLQDLNPQNLAMILWVSAIYNFYDPSLIDPLVEKVRMLLQNEGNFNPIQIRQLYHFHLISNLLPEIVPFFQKTNDQQCLRDDEQHIRKGTDNSPLERQAIPIIESMLDGQGWRIGRNHREHGFEFDITLVSNGRKINFEIDGLDHDVKILRDRFRDRILEEVLGWEVVRIHHSELRNPRHIQRIIWRRLRQTKVI